MNNLPHDWQNNLLGEIAKTITTGKTPSTQVEDYFNGDVNWFTPSDIGKSKFLVESRRTLTQKAISEGKAILFEGNTLLITCIGDIGRVGVLRTASSSNQQITSIKFDEYIDVNYAYYWFLKNSYKLANLANNAVVPILNNAQLKEIAFQYPPINIQKKLADLLDKADSIRKKRQESIRLADEFLRSTFLDMFGNIDVNDRKFDEYKFEDKLKLITYGLTIRPEYLPSGIPLISAKEIRSGIIDYQNAPKISQQNFDELTDKAKPKKNDILFSKTGSIGHCAIVKSEIDFAITQNAARLSFDLDVNPIYALFYLRSPQIQRLANANAKGNAVKDLQLGVFKNFTFLLPPIILQNRFASIAEKIEKIKENYQSSFSESENLFNSLMQRTFRGEL